MDLQEATETLDWVDVRIRHKDYEKILRNIVTFISHKTSNIAL